MKDELESIGRWIRDAWGTWAAIAGFIAVAAGFVRWLRQQGQARENIPRARFAYRNTFIDRVWRQRIVIGLERSLRHKVEMQLVGRNTPELIRLNYSQIAAKPGEIMSIDQAFAKSGRQLIIAGPPGSGKTTEALKLIRWLLEEARHDTSAPVPELFQLASWAKKRGPLAEWLADEVQRRHGGNRRDRLALIVHQQVAPVLDGLDEVAQEHRADCVQAIKKFWEQYRDVPLVVCSRLTEYEQLSERIKL